MSVDEFLFIPPDGFYYCKSQIYKYKPQYIRVQNEIITDIWCPEHVKVHLDILDYLGTPFYRIHDNNILDMLKLEIL